MNKELEEGISYFEQILDVLPGERTALEFLCVACSQLGDQAKVLKYALALSEVVMREKDAQGAADLVEKLANIDDPQAKEAVLKLQVLATPPPVEVKIERGSDWMSSATQRAAVQAELALLSKLVTEGVLVKDAVKPAFDRLENPPEVEGDFLISALSILEKENLPGAAEAQAAVADAAHAPPVPLDAFELVPGDVRKLPERLVRLRGVVPFAKLGAEWAVAVLNPLDGTLKDEISEALEAKCHFFLTPPDAMERALLRLFAKEEGGEKAEETVKNEEPAGEQAQPAVPPAVQPQAPSLASGHKPRIGIRRPGK